MIRKYIGKFITWAENWDSDTACSPHSQEEYHDGVVEVTRIYQIGNGFLIHKDPPQGNRHATNPVKNTPAVYCDTPEAVGQHLITAGVLKKLNP